MVTVNPARNSWTVMNADGSDGKNQPSITVSVMSAP